MYRKTEYRKIKYRKTDVQTYMYHTFLYRHTYKGIETYRHTDGQTNKQTDRQILYIEANSWIAGKQEVMQTDLQTDQYSHLLYIHTVLYIRQTCRQTDRQTGETEKNDIQTNKLTDRQYMSAE